MTQQQFPVLVQGLETVLAAKAGVFNEYLSYLG